MAYIPDWCSYKFTPGQMARMISQVKNEKDYIYCNYADVEDPMFANVPCASTATSPNCGSAAPTVSLAPSSAPIATPSSAPTMSHQPTLGCVADGEGLLLGRGRKTGRPRVRSFPAFPERIFPERTFPERMHWFRTTLRRRHPLLRLLQGQR